MPKPNKFKTFLKSVEMAYCFSTIVFIAVIIYLKTKNENEVPAVGFKIYENIQINAKNLFKYHNASIFTFFAKH